MSTPRSQRVVIWVIAVVMTVGTFLSFYVMVLNMDNQQKDYAKQLEDYQSQQKLASQLNADNSVALTGYTTRTFDANSVTELKVEVLKEGDGQTVKSTDTINSSYFGWLPTGAIFDSSQKKDSEDAPIDFSLASVIKGWTQGLTGQKVGSVVRLTIPADLAYGSQESGIIPANSPLEFVVEIHSIK